MTSTPRPARRPSFFYAKPSTTRTSRSSVRSCPRDVHGPAGYHVLVDATRYAARRGRTLVIRNMSHQRRRIRSVRAPRSPSPSRYRNGRAARCANATIQRERSASVPPHALATQRTSSCPRSFAVRVSTGSVNGPSPRFGRLEERTPAFLTTVRADRIVVLLANRHRRSSGPPFRLPSRRTMPVSVYAAVPLSDIELALAARLVHVAAALR